MPPGGPIRIDGILDFLQPDGSLAASILVEIADTFETQRKGLMGRRELPDSRGMLFVFEGVTHRKFWMKDTPISLDIVFVGEDGCVVYFAESTPPLSEHGIGSGKPVKYVVEVRAGFAKRFKIDTDTCIQWRRLEAP